MPKNLGRWKRRTLKHIFKSPSPIISSVFCKLENQDIAMLKFYNLLLLLSILGTLFSCRNGVKKPNVLIILTDDQGYGDFSATGNPHLQTPNLDELKATSVSFTNFFVSPLCAPTRASLLSGKYHPRTGTIGVTGGLERMRTEEFTLAEAFKENGYETACFGKWHNGEHYPENPIGQGFDKFVGFCAGHWNNYFNAKIQIQDSLTSFKGYLPDFLTDQAIAFMKNSKDPFFCYLPLNTPHSPNQVPDTYFNRFRNMGLEDELSAIYGMVENIDFNIGRITEFLKKEGLEENTIVLFLCDNGPNTDRYNANLKGRKGSVHEGGVRSPLFMKWINKWPEGFEVNQLAAHIDIFPTLTQLCNLNLQNKPDWDGIDLIPFCTPNSQTMDREIYSLVTYSKNEVPTFPAAIRTENYRWVHTKEGNEIYDIKRDPYQTKNLIDSLKDANRIFMKKYMSWYNSVTKNYQNAERLHIPIAWRDSEKILAQAPQAKFSGTVQFKGKAGWANDWLTSWTDADTITWTVNAKSKAKYMTYAHLEVPDLAVGSILQLMAKNSITKSPLPKPFKGKTLESPDRHPRKEVYEKEWGRYALGEINLDAGIQEIKLIFHTKDKPKTELEIKALELIRL